MLIIALIFVTSGIRAGSKMGYEAVDADFDPLVLNNCDPGFIVRLGPVGCSMSLRMIKAGQDTVIIPEEPKE